MSVQTPGKLFRTNNPSSGGVNCILDWLRHLVLVAETAYTRSRALDSLLFLYVITGQLDKMGKLVHLAKLRGEASLGFKAHLIRGEVEERVSLLQKAGQPSLADLTNSVHGLANSFPLPSCSFLPQLMVPSPPILPSSSPWPRRGRLDRDEVKKEKYRDQAVDKPNL